MTIAMRSCVRRTKSRFTRAIGSFRAHTYAVCASGREQSGIWGMHGSLSVRLAGRGAKSSTIEGRARPGLVQSTWSKSSRWPAVPAVILAAGAPKALLEDRHRDRGLEAL
jgi:hypothetical protein